MALKVWYQVGGSANFRWRVTTPAFAAIADAKAFAAGIERMGYPVCYREADEAPPSHFVRAV